MALGDRYLPSVQLVHGATRGALCHHTVKNGCFRTWVPCELEEVFWVSPSLTPPHGSWEISAEDFYLRTLRIEVGGQWSLHGCCD